MLLFWRKFLFYIFLAAYMVITPYAVLYALGYLMPPASGEFFSKTGLISVQTEPGGARIFVEGKKYSQKSPAAVQGLLPGEYEIQLTKKGFESWEKKISIVRGLATRLEPVILLPQHPKEETMMDTSMKILLPLLAEFKIFGIEENLLSSLTGVDIFLKRETEPGQKIPGAVSARVVDYVTKPGSSLVLFKTRAGSAEGWFAVHLGRERKGRNLSALIPAKADFLDWDARSPELIYFLENGNLQAVDLRKGILLPALAPDILGMGIKHGRLYLLKKDFTLWTADARGENLKQETGEEETLRRLSELPPAAWYRIEILKRDFFQKDLMLFLSSQGALFSSRAPFVLENQGVRGYQYATHSDEEKVLFWTDREISVLDFVKESEEGFQKGPLRFTLTRTGRDIRQAFWAYDDTHVIFLDGDSMYLSEARPPLPFYTRLLGRVAGGSAIFYHDLTRTLYYLHPQTRRLTRRKVTE